MRVVCGLCLGLLVCAVGTDARPAPLDYGHDFVTIGDPGNRPTLPSEVPERPTLQIGAVNYEYRMARTEVTSGHWLEFVQAYAPYVGADFANPAFTGAADFRGFGTNGVPTYSIDPAVLNLAGPMGWRYAARYCNWLHNGKALTQSAFENGAYDTSTFTFNPDGTANDQLVHHTDALYWIPSQDEWVKAAYYDPNKHGLGLEGFWRHPGGQDTPLQGGLPGEPGAQTSAPLSGPGLAPPVGSYPDVSAPWGLLDVSGGVSEWTSTGSNNTPSGGLRMIRGSRAGQGASYELLDMVEWQNFTFPGGASAGLRLAAAVPAPGSGLALGLCALLAARRRRVAPLAIASAVCALSAPATAGVLPPSYGHEFVTIGAPGNRATLPDEVPFRPWMQAGGVNYEYRMARTEITGSQWFEFVQAYAPYVGADFGSDLFSSGAIIFRGFGPGGVPTYSMDPIFNNVSIAMGWRYAARYCNWLHNSKALARDAFENGAYDTATFTNNPDGTVNDQSSRSPGALFWIPSEDEWVKAAYFDPHKHGLGMEGYWRHPGGQDTPLQGGLPGEPGAQTSAPISEPGFRPDVGSYPDISAPWGLLDVSGGAVEWTESWSMLNRFRIARGSHSGLGPFYWLTDQIDSSGVGSPLGSTWGLRIASAVPAPGAVLMIGACFSAHARRRRRIVIAAAMSACATAAHARPAPPDYGHDFVTIGAPGNRAALESERFFGTPIAGFPNLGAVNYEYRIARTEITAAQWLPFVEAFTPYWDSIGGSRLNSYFRSELLLPANGNPNAPPGWTMSPGSPDRPVTFGVRMAAYYCNWLHNGRPLGTWANPVDFSVFLSGAYDTSTFTQNPDLTYNDQVTRSEGALYWIPSLDEWTKAAHYDPNRYGQGQEGYWTSQGGQNEPLTSGPPGQGQTSAGANFPQGFDPRSIPVGSYPDVMSPWGLLDTSGGVSEWTEAPTYDIPGGVPGFFRSRIVRGSAAHIGGNYTQQDLIDNWITGNVGGSRYGFRIASAVPGPGSGLALGLCVLVGARRRRRVRG